MKMLQVGIVGCGHISQTHLKAWRRTAGCRVQGLFDVNRTLAQQRAAQFQIKRIYDDLDQLIAHCDVVDVCTPPQTHAEIARRVIEAGRDLVIEKPLVMEVDEWDQLQQLMARSSSRVTVVHNLKYTQAVQQAKRWIDQGRIGQVISIARQFLVSPQTDRMLVGQEHWSHRLPGGRWFETLPHELYVMHYLVGPLELAQVTALHTMAAPAGAPADHVVVTLANEHCVGSIHYSAHCQLNRRMTVIHGTDGVLMLDTLSDAIVLSTAHDRPWKRAVGVPFLEAGRALGRMLTDRFQYLARRVSGRSPHAALICAVDRYLHGQGPAPTPLDEIDYVVRNSDKIGREIDRQLAAATEGRQPIRRLLVSTRHVSD